MSRTSIVAGNWKMNLDRAGAAALAKAVAAGRGQAEGVDLVLCPPSVYVGTVAEAVSGGVAVGGQNMWHEASGAFTGEVSAAMLLDMGCRYVILGHSERRTLLGETDELVAVKTKAALAAGLTPIVCVGEQLAEREAGKTGDVVATQVRGSLAGLSSDELAKVVVAYEPVWAIGTGRTAHPDDAAEAHRWIRRTLGELYDSGFAAATRVVYGGSVTARNAAELFSRPEIDGGLVGGASLKADAFAAICRAAEARLGTAPA